MRKLLTKGILVLAFLSLGSLRLEIIAQVSAWESTVEMSSYLLREAETAPIFERDWSYQRARRSVYPYPMNDNMTREKDTVTYKALFLENEYVKLCILPEIGGRLMWAVDKTNGYDIFYRNEVVKPANVGMLGAWISGGVEWNVFHHHRATSHSPVDYTITESSDGSKTIWIGETELRHRMSWAIGVTLHPGKSYMEISGRLINSTADNNSMLYWSNVSTHVDENYQIIFPQSTEFVTFHCKNWFAHWPITHETFNDQDGYQNYVDASWWKNHFMSNSMFVHDLKEDYIAGYDHGRHAGTMLTGNHNIIKGGKFWLWGPNSEWDTRILTDSSGHYCELMVGAYSDNQPDYSWIYPYEVKEFSQYWYGLRELGGVKAGDKEAAINMDFQGKGKVFVGVNTTELRQGLELVLLRNGDEAWKETLDVAPDKPFIKTIQLNKDVSEEELSLRLLDEEGQEMLSYSPVYHNPDDPLPGIVEKPLLPHEIENSEECFLVGLRNLQFHNPFIRPTDYFEEVLRRDDGDIRANTQMGIWYRQRGEYEKAASHLHKAIKRQTKDYTRPSDCEALYNLGLILKAQGKIEAAIDTLYRAVWNYAYNSPGNYQLAQIYSCQEDYEKALDRLDEAIDYNGRNYSAINLKASVLRTLGDKEGATICTDRVLATDPLNTYSLYERFLLSGDETYVSLLGSNPEAYIELALAYLHNGFRDIAQDILLEIDHKLDYPTVKMWLAYMADTEGNNQTAKELYEEALALPVGYCNPFRLETIPVLEKALEYFPDNARIYYYLGNLLFDKQQTNGIKCWEKSAELDSTYAMTWRNMGYAHWLHTKDFAKAESCYLRAIALEPDNALFLEEADQAFEAGGVNPVIRYGILKEHHNACVRRYYPLSAEVVTGTFVGDYDYVLKLLETCYFPTREGVANFHDVYVDALLLSGKEKVAQELFEDGISLFLKAFDYPENHQVFLVDERTPRDAQIWWFIADAYEKAGDKARAKDCYKKSTEVDVKRTNYRYWQALSLRRLGREDEAAVLLDAMEATGTEGIVDHVVNFYGAEGTTGQTVEGVNTKAYYTLGLARLGKGDIEGAKVAFGESIRLKRDNLWAVTMNNDIK